MNKKILGLFPVILVLLNLVACSEQTLVPANTPLPTTTPPLSTPSVLPTARAITPFVVPTEKPSGTPAPTTIPPTIAATVVSTYNEIYAPPTPAPTVLLPRDIQLLRIFDTPSDPCDVAVDAQGNIYVVDGGKNRILQFWQKP
jgi:NHL repeat